MNTLKMAWLFPDTLYLHGERGNILALKRFAGFAGFHADVDKIDFTTKEFNPMDYDIIFCPPGEITSFPVLLDILAPKKDAFKEFVEAGRPLIATGTSVALWCEKVKRADGSEFDGMGIIKADAVENEKVYGDDINFICSYNGKEIEVLGNQIQMADFINKGETTFGKLLYGYGNTGENREEGFQVKNSVFTNTLGPMLVLCPMLTMEIIKTAAANKGLEAADFDYDMEIEEKSFATKKAFIQKKTTRLTNCK